MNKLLLLIIPVVLASCTKYKDSTPPDLSGQLTRPYCNVPTAINYNDSFPGKADSSVCVYATDRYVGTWDVVDSIFFDDTSLQQVKFQTYIITAPADSSRQLLRLTGWCSDPSSPLLLRASKFSNAYFNNTVGESDSGQVVCAITDTIVGSIKVLTNADSIIFTNAQVRSALGVLRHQAKGTKR